MTGQDRTQEELQAQRDAEILETIQAAKAAEAARRVRLESGRDALISYCVLYDSATTRETQTIHRNALRALREVDLLIERLEHLLDRK